MKDFVQSVEVGVPQQRRVEIKSPKVWLRNEVSRVGLAEFLSTYIMMVRIQTLKGILSMLTQC